jgi:hypothetical protein
MGGSQSEANTGKSMRPHLKNKLKQKGLGECPQYHKNKKQKKLIRLLLSFSVLSFTLFFLFLVSDRATVAILQ